MGRRDARRRNRAGHRPASRGPLALALAVLATSAAAQTEVVERTGRGIMEEAQRRHEHFPYVYEEQSMVLMDAAGNRDVRRCRRYSRVEEDGTAKFLLVFDDPEVIRGVALLAVRDPDGDVDEGVYLPAFGPEFKRPAEETRGGRFLGTDFTIADLTPEVLADYRYVGVGERLIGEVEYFVVEAYPRDASVERATGYGMRRHLVRKDIFFVSRTDYFDRSLRFVRRLTRHDLQRVHEESWRANMIVVHDLREQHRSLLKIDRRVFSRDYVPAEIFEPEYLLANRHVEGSEAHVAGGAEPPPEGGLDGS